MMPRTKLDPALAKRLEALTGEDAACCASDLRALAGKARERDAFRASLLRAKALSDEGRLLTASLLKASGELCGCQIQAALGLTHATVSHHMALLQDAGVVASERRGKWTYYRLTDEALPLIP